MKRVIMCRFAPLNAKGQLRPAVVTTAEFLALQAAGCSAEIKSPPGATVAPGDPCLLLVDVPDAQAVALEPTFTAIDALPETRVLPSLRGTDTLSNAQRTRMRQILDAFGVDGTAASQASADFGDFIRYVLRTAWQHSEFDKARIT